MSNPNEQHADEVAEHLAELMAAYSLGYWPCDECDESESDGDHQDWEDGQEWHEYESVGRSSFGSTDTRIWESVCEYAMDAQPTDNGTRVTISSGGPGVAIEEGGNGVPVLEVWSAGDDRARRHGSAIRAFHAFHAGSVQEWPN